MKHQRVYLSRRNLLTLIAKLDRVRDGEDSTMTLIKRDTAHETYPCTSVISVTAVEDEDYYTDREPGETMEQL